MLMPWHTHCSFFAELLLLPGATGSPAWSMYIADFSDEGSMPTHTLQGLNESLDAVDGTPWGASSLLLELGERFFRCKVLLAELF